MCLPITSIPTSLLCSDNIVCVQSFAGNYTGHAKVNRLVFIAEKTADAQLALSALRIAADELKKVLQSFTRTQANGLKLGPLLIVCGCQPCTGLQHCEVQRRDHQDQWPPWAGLPV